MAGYCFALALSWEFVSPKGPDSLGDLGCGLNFGEYHILSWKSLPYVWVLPTVEQLISRELFAS